MTGTSYDGTLCLAAATTGIEGLEAIIPTAPVASYNNYYRSNGLVRSPCGYLGEDVDVLYDFINSGDVLKRASNNENIRDEILVKNQDRITGDYNDFWESRKGERFTHTALLSPGRAWWPTSPFNDEPLVYKILAWA